MTLLKVVASIVGLFFLVAEVSAQGDSFSLYDELEQYRKDRASAERSERVLDDIFRGTARTQRNREDITRIRRKLEFIAENLDCFSARSAAAELEQAISRRERLGVQVEELKILTKMQATYGPILRACAEREQQFIESGR